MSANRQQRTFSNHHRFRNLGNIANDVREVLFVPLIGPKKNLTVFENFIVCPVWKRTNLHLSHTNGTDVEMIALLA